MISFMPSPPSILYEIGDSLSEEYGPYAAAYADDDPALTAPRWIERQQWLFQANAFQRQIAIQRQIDALRARLVALEQEQQRVLASLRPEEEEDTISLALNAVRTIPARIVGKMKSSFYLYGSESEE